MNMDIFFYSLVLFAVASSGTLCIYHIAVRRAWLDHPTSRGSHHIPTPRGGGLAINGALLLGFGILYFHDMISIQLWAGFSGSICLLTIIGFVDDLSDVHPLLRFCGQCLACIWGMVLLGNIPAIPLFHDITLPAIFAYPLLFLLLLWLTNLYNFMDGIDAITSLETIFLSISIGCFAYLHESWSLFYLMAFLAASSLGFLVWNWPPASIFMGDCASTALGCFLGLVVIAFSLEDLALFWPCLILMNYYLIDSTMTLLLRVWERKPWYKPHREHLYQQLALKMSSHLKANAVVMAINLLWLFPLAYVAFQSVSHGFFIFIFSALPLIIAVFTVRKRETKK